MVPGKEFIALSTATFVHVGVEANDKVVDVFASVQIPKTMRFPILFV